MWMWASLYHAPNGRMTRGAALSGVVPLAPPESRVTVRLERRACRTSARPLSSHGLQENLSGSQKTAQPHVRVRFAPSPTGSLHIGSARTALFNWLFARRHGGAFVLRIEDTDVRRSCAEHERAIITDLQWLGLHWDEGPDVGGAFAPYRQSERAARHTAVAEHLIATGKAYRCFCPPERLEELRTMQRASGLTPRYDRRCAAIPAEEAAARTAAGEPAAVRLRVPDHTDLAIEDLLRGEVVFPAGAVGDFIILRSSGGASYNFAAAVDDLDMAITHVIRGDDHLSNTARQQLVFTALGARPPRYAHHSMVLGSDGGKLSKRHGATAVGDYRDAGYLPAAVVNYLALLSWSHGGEEVFTVAALEQEFVLEELSTSPAVFDQGKLDWLGHQHVMLLDEETHLELMRAWLPATTAAPAVAALAAALKPSISSYGQVPELAAPVLDAPTLSSLGELLASRRCEGVPLEEFLELRAAGPVWLQPPDARRLLGTYRQLAANRGLGARKALPPLRLLLTGHEHGPELHYVLAAIDRDEALRRVRCGLALLRDLAHADRSPTHDPGGLR